MLRSLVPEDLSQVLIVEELTQIAPWSIETFQRCLEVGYLGWVKEIDHQVVGFIMITAHSVEAHILNLCVHPEFQRQGVGRELLLYALNMAQSMGIGIAFLEVRRSNLAAIILYEKLGFIKIGERKDYYPSLKGREDALIFAKDLGVK